MSEPRIWTIPAGQPFARRLVAELLQRARPSTDLGDLTIFVPTNRSARILSQTFIQEARPRALLLPRIRPLGDVGEEHVEVGGEGSEAAGADDAPPPAIGPVQRQLLLTRLVASMRRERAGGTLEEAARLAAELGDLLDSLQNQDVDLSDLEALVEGDLAEHWQETLRFLEILRDHWPSILADTGHTDPMARRAWLLRQQAAVWAANPPQAPVIVAGSTGSIPAARELIRTVAALPSGEVVLAGLDRAIDADSWDGLDESHAQFGLKRLLETLGVDRKEVRDWPGSGVPPHAASRARLLSEVMRPAATAHRWNESVGEFDIAAGLKGMQVIEARDSVEEAGVIAVRMRETLETPGKTAALVTNDRELANRVRITLRRWNVDVDDTGGMPLADTRPAALFRLAARAAAGDGAPVDLLALLKHAYANGGGDRQAFLARVHEFERRIVRRGSGLHGFADYRADLRRRLEAAPQLAGLQDWYTVLEDRFAPFRKALDARTPANEIALAHRTFVEWLAGAGSAEESPLYADRAGEQVRTFFDEFQTAIKALGPIPGREYPGILDASLDRIASYPRAAAHPRLSILSALEARLVSADLVIAGGLVEGSWPRRATPNPWLSRGMQATLGLLTDAHRAGMGAHDFVNAASAPEACLTFARKAHGNPTVRSRWLTRLNTVLRAGNHQPPAPRALDLWRRFTVPPPYKPRPQPSFAPPVDARPRRLSVTQVRTLKLEPYAIYGRHVLGLRALPPPGSRPGAAEFGTAVHRALEQFMKETAGTDLPADAAAKLHALGVRALTRLRSDNPHDDRWWSQLTWIPRFAAIAEWFLRQEQSLRQTARTLCLEADGEYTFGSPPFTLTARADRIDVDCADGAITISDYKTGGIPSHKDVANGEDPQLPLTGVISEAGGFPALPGENAVGALVYWKLTGRGAGGELVHAVPADKLQNVLANSAGSLTTIVAQYDDPATEYKAVHAPEPYSDYATLARTHEWTLAGLQDSDE